MNSVQHKLLNKQSNNQTYLRWIDSPDEKVGRSLVEIQNGSVGVTATNKTQPDPENWRKSARDNRQRVAIEVLWDTESLGTEEHCELSVWLVAPGPHWAPPSPHRGPPHATPPLLIGRPARSCPINNCIVLPQRDNTVKNWAKRGRASLECAGCGGGGGVWDTHLFNPTREIVGRMLIVDLQGSLIEETYLRMGLDY